jgi:uracil phosphoribosyltransferase
MQRPWMGRDFASALRIARTAACFARADRRSRWRLETVSEAVVMDTFSNVTVVEHPLVQHKLTLMRRRDVPTTDFRRLVSEVALLLAYEVTRDLPIETTRIETPLEEMDAPILAGKKLCFVSILRAGNGILDGMLDLVPSARVGHIGLYRDPKTLEPIEYYLKVPEDIGERLTIVVDPMLATGHSAAAAIERLKGRGATNIRFVCLLAAPEGLRVLNEAHHDVQVFTASVDRELDDHGYIRPGLGDAGDRLFGTK